MAVAVAPRPSARVLLPVAWPLYAGFLLLPVFWILGLAPFIWPILAAPMALHLLLQREIRVPRGAGLYALFLLWALASAVQLTGAGVALVFAYRLSLYASAGVFFLYVYNAPRELLPGRMAARVLVGFWVIVAIGGLAGVAFPQASFHAALEGVLPGGLVGNAWVHEMMHVSFAQVHDFLGYPLPRPSAPFTYTNQWGSAYALLLPYVALAFSRPSRWRPWGVILLLATLVPVIVSVNRGLWLSVGLGLGYVGVRLLLQGRARTVALLGLAAVIGVIVVTASPLGGVVQERFATPHSNSGRLSLYQQAIEETSASPLLGFGSTVPSQDAAQPSVGTHGLLWMLMVSHGLPAAMLFVGWLGLVLWRTRRLGSEVQFWSHVVLLLGAVQMTFYGLLPVSLMIMMVAAALSLREVAHPAAPGARSEERPG